jgi:hypothetical protein
LWQRCWLLTSRGAGDCVAIGVHVGVVGDNGGSNSLVLLDLLGIIGLLFYFSFPILLFARIIILVILLKSQERHFNQPSFS